MSSPSPQIMKGLLCDLTIVFMLVVFCVMTQIHLSNDIFQVRVYNETELFLIP